MPYAQLLANLISEKNLSVKEVAERCINLGANITPSYISMIKNPDNKKIPSDEVSRALAKACEAEHENCLVIEAYVDKAPEEFEKVLEFVRTSVMSSLLIFFKNSIPEEQWSVFVGNYNKLPMAEFISLAADISKLQDTAFSKVSDILNVTTTLSEESYKVIAELKQPEGFKICDSDMEPVIPNGSMVFPEILEIQDYKNGDIILVKIKGTKALIVRNCLFDENKSTITLFAYNPKTAPVTLAIDQVSIIGKVKRIITDLQ